MSRVGLDLDGVLYPFHTAYRDWLVANKIRTPEECPEPKRWEFYLDWKLTLDEFLIHFTEGVDAGHIFWKGEPFKDAARQVQRLKADGHTVHIVTDRFVGMPGMAASATFNWLEDHFIQYDSVTFSADKTVARTDYFLDDKPANIAALTQAGSCEAYLLCRSWNKDARDLRITSSLSQFVSSITRSYS